MAARATKTTLVWGLIPCDIALYRTVGDAEKPPKWEQAGPNGGRLLAQDTRGVDAIVESEAGTPSRGTAQPFSDVPSPAERDHAALLQAEREANYPIEEGTGEKVAPEDCRLGIRDANDRFIDLTAEIASIAERTKLEEMRIADFIRVEEIRREWVVGSYYVAPDGPTAPKAIRLLHEAMRSQKRVAVVKWTKRSKQALGVLVPHPATKSLMCVELAWDEDKREVPRKVYVPGEVEVTKEEIHLAREMVEVMSSTRAASLDVQTDDSRGLIRDLLEQANEGDVGAYLLPERPPLEKGADVIYLIRRGLSNPDELRRAAA
jgi:non-homologous end joining protein Ku